MRHLRNLGTQFSVSFPPDEEGLTGRECPESDCEGYFKIEFGTGLKESDLPCHCPYCGHRAGHDQFFTQAQIEYARSIVANKVTGALLKDFKSLEFNHRPKGAFGIGLSMKVQGRPTPIRHYHELDLETDVVCDRCTLHYTIYGVFGFCPDCAVHNSLQILNKNLELVEKLLALAVAGQEMDVAKQLIENALEDCVSAFDGFGRETCRVFSSKAINPAKAVEIRFQNVAMARERVKDQFGVDFANKEAPDDWKAVLTAFQKRHLLAHKMGVIDKEYLSATGEVSGLGRRVTVEGSEVSQLVTRLKSVAEELFNSLNSPT